MREYPRVSGRARKGRACPTVSLFALFSCEAKVTVAHPPLLLAIISDVFGGVLPGVLVAVYSRPCMSETTIVQELNVCGGGVGGLVAESIYIYVLL